MRKFLNFLKCKYCWGNSFVWAKNCNCKDLLTIEAKKWIFGHKVLKAIDIGSGTSNDLKEIVPEAKEFHFLDNFRLPKKSAKVFLHKQSVKEKIKVPDGYFDLVISNGSFDHFRQSEREVCFKEIERVLRPGGRFLFACEYFDYLSKKNFQIAAKDKELKKANCQYFSNINLKKIINKTQKLKIIQENMSYVPDGRSLSKMPMTKGIKIFNSKTKYGLENRWGSFFCVFVKNENS